MDHFKKANGPQMAQLGAVSDVAVVDADTIDINLTAPDPALEYFLSQAAGLMGSPKALGTEGIKTEPVGSGPYVMDKAASVKDSQTVFTAREGLLEQGPAEVPEAHLQDPDRPHSPHQRPGLRPGGRHHPGPQERQAGRGRQDEAGRQRGRLAGPAPPGPGRCQEPGAGRTSRSARPSTTPLTARPSWTRSCSARAPRPPSRSARPAGPGPKSWRTTTATIRPRPSSSSRKPATKTA